MFTISELNLPFLFYLSTCRNDSVLWGASVTMRKRVLPRTARTRISNPVSGGHCHLIQLTILRRFSSLKYWIFTNLFILKPEYQSGVRTRDLRLFRQAVLTTAPPNAQCRSNARSVSQTVAQHWNNIGLVSRVCRIYEALYIDIPS